MPTEADTCRKYVLPKLYAAGWSDDQIIDPLNALRVPLREIGEKNRVDVIITNPPFGGEEEKGIQGNFPEDNRAALSPAHHAEAAQAA